MARGPLYELSLNSPRKTMCGDIDHYHGTPNGEDEFILDIGLNRAIELIDKSNAENIYKNTY